MSIKNKHMEENRTKVFGMEVGLLLEDAERWWNGFGREKMRNRQFSSEAKEQQMALDAVNPVHPNYIGGKSGILTGSPWVMLTVQERYRVVKAYTLAMKRREDGEDE